MSSVNVYAIAAKSLGINVLMEVKCTHTFLSLQHNKRNNHHYDNQHNGNYAQESTDENGRITSNYMNRVEK